MAALLDQDYRILWTSLKRYLFECYNPESFLHFCLVEVEGQKPHISIIDLMNGIRDLEKMQTEFRENMNK